MIDDDWEHPDAENYCESGEHYIGDADECERCKEFERLKAEEREHHESDADE